MGNIQNLVIFLSCKLSFTLVVLHNLISPLKYVWKIVLLKKNIQFQIKALNQNTLLSSTQVYNCESNLFTFLRFFLFCDPIYEYFIIEILCTCALMKTFHWLFFFHFFFRYRYLCYGLSFNYWFKVKYNNRMFVAWRNELAGYFTEETIFLKFSTVLENCQKITFQFNSIWQHCIEGITTVCVRDCGLFKMKNAHQQTQTHAGLGALYFWWWIFKLSGLD